MCLILRRVYYWKSKLVGGLCLPEVRVLAGLFGLYAVVRNEMMDALEVLALGCSILIEIWKSRYCTRLELRSLMDSCCDIGISDGLDLGKSMRIYHIAWT